jgi:hypothetical protein
MTDSTKPKTAAKTPATTTAASPPPTSVAPGTPPASADRWEKKNVIHIRGKTWIGDAAAPLDEKVTATVEPWLTALMQAEHLNLLLSNGFTTAVANACSGTTPAGMWRLKGAKNDLSAVAAEAATLSAERNDRGAANIEDDIRLTRRLLDGLDVLLRDGPTATKSTLLSSAKSLLAGAHQDLRDSFEKELTDFLESVLATERHIRNGFHGKGSSDERPLVLIGAFLLAFASRAATRERLHIFTTNYDRLIEFCADLLGLHVLDRFVGTLNPIFRSSRLALDVHYNPPGIRGEPRYLEGVVRLTKLHGSLDWRHSELEHGGRDVWRDSLPFGADSYFKLPKKPGDNVMIYPNAAKDVETLEYPYADLFRDFSAATCQPNAVLVTYGYGFGDDHINRTIRDMMTIPSTHLVIISYNSTDGRVTRFCDRLGRDEQLTVLLGPKVAGLGALVENFLPKPAIDRNTWKMMELLMRRRDPSVASASPASSAPHDPTGSAK